MTNLEYFLYCEIVLIATEIKNESKKSEEVTTQIQDLADGLKKKIAVITKEKYKFSLMKDLRKRALFANDKTLLRHVEKIRDINFIKNDIAFNHKSECNLLMPDYQNKIKQKFELDSVSYDEFFVILSNSINEVEEILNINSNKKFSDKLIKEDLQNSKYAAFYNTTWLLYLHGDLDNSTTRYSIICRWVLHINDTGEVTIYNSKDSLPVKGMIVDEKYSTQNVLEFFIIKGFNGSSNWNLRFSIAPEINVSTILIGQYILSEAIERKTKSGTVIIENILGKDSDYLSKVSLDSKLESKYSLDRGLIEVNNRKIRIIEVELVHYNNWQELIPKPIAKFLSNKRRNYRKINPLIEISTVEGLNEFFKKQAKKKTTEYKFNTEIKYDLFILMPKHSVEEMGRLSDEEKEQAVIERKKIEDEIDEIFFGENYKSIHKDYTIGETFSENSSLYERTIRAHEKLYTRKIHNIYFQPRVRRIFEDYTKGSTRNKFILKNEMKAMQQSRFVLYISISEKASSALIKLGWAMAFEKGILVFRLKDINHPALINESFNFIDVYKDVKKIEEIREEILSYYPPQAM